MKKMRKGGVSILEREKRKWKGASLEDPEDCHGDVE